MWQSTKLVWQTSKLVEQPTHQLYRKLRPCAVLSVTTSQQLLCCLAVTLSCRLVVSPSPLSFLSRCPNIPLVRLSAISSFHCPFCLLSRCPAVPLSHIVLSVRCPAVRSDKHPAAAGQSVYFSPHQHRYTPARSPVQRPGWIGTVTSSRKKMTSLCQGGRHYQAFRHSQANVLIRKTFVCAFHLIWSSLACHAVSHVTSAGGTYTAWCQF